MVDISLKWENENTEELLPLKKTELVSLKLLTSPYRPNQTSSVLMKPFSLPKVRIKNPAKQFGLKIDDDVDVDGDGDDDVDDNELGVLNHLGDPLRPMSL